MFKSLRQAAAWWEVPLTTLSKRVKGRQDRPTYNQTRQKLTVGEEEAFVEYIRRQILAGYPLSTDAVQQMANVLLQRR